MQNRRSKVRYPISLPVRFAVSSKDVPSIGFGTLVDISSKGVAFRAKTGLLTGMKVRASIGWSAVLSDQCALQLCVEGRVVRVDGSLVALSIDRYAFRTAAKVKPTKSHVGFHDIGRPNRSLLWLIWNESQLGDRFAHMLGDDRRGHLFEPKAAQQRRVQWGDDPVQFACTEIDPANGAYWACTRRQSHEMQELHRLLPEYSEPPRKKR
jgi:hypothetical protein